MNRLFAVQCKGVLLAAQLLFCTISANAAALDNSTYQALLREIQHKQYAAVQINLDIEVPLQSPSPALRSQITALEDQVLRDLQGTILPSSVWRSGLGQLGVRVSANGIDILAKHGAIRRVIPDSTRRFRQSVYDSDGRLDRIEAEIASRGYADIEIVENLDSLVFEFGKDGAVLYKQSGAQRDEIAARRVGFIQSLPASGFVNLDKALTLAKSLNNVSSVAPTFTLRATRDGFYHLIEHSYVRAASLAGTANARAALKVDPAALENATSHGDVSVLIDLQRTGPYSPLKGRMSPQAWAAQSTAIDKAFSEILDPVDPAWRKRATVSLGIASVTATLSLDALNSLARTADPRLLGIKLNEPIIVPTLAESTVQINVQNAYTKGYRGAGQTIAVVDTGVLSTHPFLKDANGNSKVWLEACYGTTGNNSFGSFFSICPNLPPVHTTGDTGGTGSAAPYPSVYGSGYWHGTHVAGIAVGRGGPNGVNGVAPDARIIAAQVISGNTYGDAKGAPADLGQALYDATTLNNRNITVNMSLSYAVNPYEYSAGACDNLTRQVTDSVAALNSLGIPVVAATGNEGYIGKSGWPACISGIIKVGAVDDVTAQRWANSNNPNPDTMVGPIFLAPGIVISSSVPFSKDPTGYATSFGTSMAAPHVSGVYALAKAELPTYSVADITSWINSFAVVSMPIQVDPFNPSITRSVGRLVLPTLPTKPGF